MGDFSMANSHLKKKIKGAVHWRNLGHWGEFGCLKRKATKICMLVELVSKTLFMKVLFL